MTGSVVFVGADPGDPKLIALRGWRVLREADVDVYADDEEKRDLRPDPAKAGIQARNRHYSA